MAKQNKVRKKLIPYEAGIVIVAPLDDNKRPDFSRAVATERNYLSTTQTSVTRSTEDLENGNGADKTFITDERYELEITSNVYNPDFHALVTGRLESLPEKVLLPMEANALLPTDTTADMEIAFGANTSRPLVPAADKDGRYNFIVSDSIGNRLSPTDATTPQNGEYHYDADTKALQFSTDYAGQSMRVIYYYASTDSYVIKNNPIIQQPEFYVQVMGIVQDADANTKYRVVTTLQRATLTGDISEQPTQKAKSAPITYTFQSAPVPECMSVYSQVFAPMSNTACAQADSTSTVSGNGGSNAGTGGGTSSNPDVGQGEVTVPDDEW